MTSILAERTIAWQDAPKNMKEIIFRLQRLKKLLSDVDEEEKQRIQSLLERKENVLSNTYGISYHQYSGKLFVKQHKFEINKDTMSDMKIVDGDQQVVFFYLLNDNGSLTLNWYEGLYHGDILRWSDEVSVHDKNIELSKLDNYSAYDPLAIIGYPATYVVFGCDKSTNTVSNVSINEAIVYKISYEMSEFNPKPVITYSYINSGKFYNCYPLKTVYIDLNNYYENITKNRFITFTTMFNNSTNNSLKGFRSVVGALFNKNSDNEEVVYTYITELTLDTNIPTTELNKIKDTKFTGIACSDLIITNNTDIGYIIVVAIGKSSDDSLMKLYTIVKVDVNANNGEANITAGYWETFDIKEPRKSLSLFNWNNIIYDRHLNQFVISSNGIVLTESEKTDNIITLNLHPVLSSSGGDNITFMFNTSYTVLLDGSYMKINDIIFDNYYNNVFISTEGRGIGVREGNLWNTDDVLVNTDNPITSISSCGNGKMYALELANNTTKPFVRVCVLNYDIENEWKNLISEESLPTDIPIN